MKNLQYHDHQQVNTLVTENTSEGSRDWQLMVVPGCTAEQKALPTLLSLTQKNDADFFSLCCIHKGKESLQKGRWEFWMNQSCQSMQLVVQEHWQRTGFVL